MRDRPIDPDIFAAGPGTLGELLALGSGEDQGRGEENGRPPDDDGEDEAWPDESDDLPDDEGEADEPTDDDAFEEDDAAAAGYAVPWWTDPRFSTKLDAVFAEPA